jgi:hypothetical protein
MKAIFSDKKRAVDKLTLGEFRSLFEKGGCPICGICARSLGSFYFWFVQESYYNPSMIEELKESYGFCKEHAWKLIEASRPYITGVMYEYLTEALEKRLSQLLAEIRVLGGKKGGLKRWGNHQKEFEKVRQALTDRSCCPACKSIERSERYASDQFLAVLKEQEMKDLYLKSGGLCFCHLQQVLSISNESEATFLIQDGIERSQRLNDELREFLRKVAYQYRNEPKGAEQTSWIRAAEFFVGRIYDPLALLKRYSGAPG